MGGGRGGRDGEQVGGHLGVDEPPVVEEVVDAGDAAHVSSEAAPTGRQGQVLARVLPVGVDHEVAVGEIGVGGLGGELAGEELGQRIALDLVGLREVEPAAGGFRHVGRRLLLGRQRDVVQGGRLDHGEEHGLVGGQV